MRDLNRREFLTHMGIGGAAAFLAACAPTATAPSGAQTGEGAGLAPAVSEAIELRFVNRDLPFGAHMIEFSRRYEQENPNITVRNEDVSWNDIPIKTQLYMVGNTLADVMWQQGDLLAFYAYKGAYNELRDLVDAENYELDEFFPWLVSGHCTYDGKLYALPGEPNPGQGSCTFVNVDMFKEKGLEVPDDDWTMDEFREYSSQLADHDNGIFAFDLGWHRQTMGVWVGTWGGTLTKGGPHRGLGEEFSFTTDAKVVEAMQYYLGMRVTDHLMPLAQELVEGGALTMWLSKRMAMVAGNMGNLQGLNDTVGGQFEWKAIMSPVGPEGQRGSANNTVQWQIGATTDYPEEAWGLVKLLASVECSTWNTLNTGKQPGGRVQSWQDPAITSLPFTGEMFARYGEWMASGEVDMMPSPANLLTNEFNDMFQQEGQPLDNGILAWDVQAAIIQEKGEEIFSRPRP